MYVILLDRIDPQKCKQGWQYRMNFNLRRNSPEEDVFLKKKEGKKIYENFVWTLESVPNREVSVQERGSMN